MSPAVASANDEFRALLSGLRLTGLRAADIAAKSGVASSTIWKLQNGAVNAPSLSTCLAVGRAYQSVLGHPPPPLRFGRRMS